MVLVLFWPSFIGIGCWWLLTLVPLALMMFKAALMSQLFWSMRREHRFTASPITLIISTEGLAFDGSFDRCFCAYCDLTEVILSKNMVLVVIDPPPILPITIAAGRWRNGDGLLPV